MFVPADSANASYINSAYWAKIWPASIGLCHFLSANPAFIQNKIIAELAAGLGLPSIYVASTARHVYTTDIEPEAVKLVMQSAIYNQLSNITVTVMNWENPDNSILFDTLLLSDVNYEPNEFEALHKTIIHYLHKGVTIILSTPQRLMAKPFINQLLPYCHQQETVTVELENTFTDISVFVLRK